MKISTKGKYYGKRDTELSCDEILLSKYDYHLDETPWHYHENPYFMYVLHGDMIDCNTKLKTLLPAGSLMFNNWQEAHFGSKHSDKAGGFHLEFEKSWFEKNGIKLDLLEGSQQIKNPRIHFLFAKLYHEFNISDSYSKVSIEVLLMQICETLINVKEDSYKTMPCWVNKFKELLHDDSSKLNLKYLSDQLDIHPVHISRSVPKYLSTSLGEYIRQHKIKKAIPLLLDSTYSLTEIGYKLGFSDQSHFIRVFKSYFNMNPSFYRKNLNKNK